MVTIRNIGEALLSHIEYNDKAPVKNINNLIQKHKLSQDEIANTNMYKKELYKTKYENPRIENKLKYELYLKERNELVNKWKQDINSQSKLLDVLNFKRPELAEIEDIYTYQYIDLNADKKTTLVIEKEKPVKGIVNVVKEAKSKVKDINVVKEVKESVEIVKDVKLSKVVKQVKAKECPEGKVLNPVTGRCITDKTKKIIVKPVTEVKSVEVKPVEVKPITEVKPVTEVKPITEVKPVTEVKSVEVKPVTEVKPKEIKVKECSEGKVLNPVTGRCINDKTKKIIVKPVTEVKPIEVKPKEIKVKECPEGKVLNPVTGRCITDKTKKKDVKPK